MLQAQKIMLSTSPANQLIIRASSSQSPPRNNILVHAQPSICLSPSAAHKSRPVHHALQASLHVTIGQELQVFQLWSSQKKQIEALTAVEWLVRLAIGVDIVLGRDVVMRLKKGVIELGAE